MFDQRQLRRFRQYFYGVLEGSGADRLGSLINWTLIALIATTLLATILQSVPRLASAHPYLFASVEWAALLAYSNRNQNRSFKAS